MATNRAQARLAIRELLKEFYDQDTVATGGISSSALTLPVNNPTRYKIGSMIQVESEYMKVEAIDTNASTVTVQRGYLGSTAAAHLINAIILITPEVTDRMLNYAINDAISNTYANRDLGDMGIWINVVDTSLVTSISTREYTIPAGFATDSFIIEILDESGHYQTHKDWHISGTKIVFHSDFDTAGLTIRIDGMGYQSRLADDSTNFTLSDDQVEFIKWAAALNIIEMRLGPRIKATAYSAAVNDRAGQPNDMILIVSHFKKRMNEVRSREARPMKSGYLTRTKR